MVVEVEPFLRQIFTNMAKISRPRYGSLQYWPRKRVERAMPRVNWDAVSRHAKYEGILGLIAYKVGMATALVRDKTEKSMTQNKKIALPVTILEVPKFRIFSIRFYNKGRIVNDLIVSNDDSLKPILKVPKKIHDIQEPKEWDEVRVLVYSVMKGMFKKTPNVAEIVVRGSKPLEFVKTHVGKELSIKDIPNLGMIDARGITRGKGLVGPVKRFGISLKSHKSEKGVRRPGSLGPWHPARVTFRTPMAGQLGMFSRIQYNLIVLSSGSVGEGAIITPKMPFNRYGMLANDYLIVAGSVQGPPKREILLTPALRPTKKQLKRKYELMELKI